MSDQTSSELPLPLPACLEALLFVAPGSVTVTQLAVALDLPTPQIEAALRQLEAQYNDPLRPAGIRLQRLHGRVQLTSAPESGPLVERFLGLEATTRLSRAALETLAIIAYKEPATHPYIDSIRGVNSDGVIKSLLSKGLIQEVGRAETPGRPILYTVTADFLGHFGLTSLEELPSLEAVLEANASEAGQPEPTSAEAA